MASLLRATVVIILGVAAAEAQGNLSEVFSIIRTEGPAISEMSRKRTLDILTGYSTGEKSITGEWSIINEALGDAKAFVRDQASAVLSVTIQRYESETRENAVRVFALIAGGITPDVRDFWVQSLSRNEEKQLQGAVLSAFRFDAQTDPQIIKLVIDALHDEDRFVRQDAIAAVTQIGRPAVAAFPLRREIQESRLSDEGMRLNAEAAIRVLSSWAANQ
jgi:hypothetical protein